MLRGVSRLTTMILKIILNSGRALPDVQSLIRKTLPVATALLVGLQAISCVGAELSSLDTARQTIAEQEIRQHVETLADDAFEGREAGEAGGRAAATYIMRALKDAKLRPAGEDGTYYQPFFAGCRNILAEVRGSDPELKREYILLTAHYDHVGFGTKRTSNGPIGAIHNGADDNASGVAAVLEVAEALREYRSPLKRSVLVVFWDGEEKGLWGSRYWLKHPTVEVRDVRLMVNVDMIGRLRDRLGLFGTRTMPGMRYAWSQANIAGDVELEFPWKVFNNSDHYVFFKRGIPITMVHTGLHDDYHTPSDDAHRLNRSGIHRIAELLLNFTVQSANRDKLASFRKESLGDSESDQQAYETTKRPVRPRLGIRLTSREPGDVRISSVELGSRADALGLKPGERIFSIGPNATEEKPISIEMIREALGSSETATFVVGDTVTKREVDVPSQSKPRIGIAWRTNGAEPDSVTISFVYDDSPAAHAGLQPLDRVHQIDGIDVESGTDFRDRMKNATGKIELLIERNGKLQIVQLIADAMSVGD